MRGRGSCAAMRRGSLRLPHPAQCVQLPNSESIRIPPDGAEIARTRVPGGRLRRRPPDGRLMNDQEQRTFPANRLRLMPFDPANRRAGVLAQFGLPGPQTLRQGPPARTSDDSGRGICRRPHSVKESGPFFAGEARGNGGSRSFLPMAQDGQVRCHSSVLARDMAHVPKRGNRPPPRGLGPRVGRDGDASRAAPARRVRPGR